MNPRATFPRYAAKVRHPALVDPADFVRRYRPGVETPTRCILVWNPAVVEHLVHRFRARPVRGAGATFLAQGEKGEVGIVLPRGVGAPTTVTTAEELVAMGTREIVGVGFAGSLVSDLLPGDVVLCDRAIRDEGTSHHYAAPGVPALPSASLQGRVVRALRTANIPFRTGPSWTTDAPYQETRAELRHYRRQGVLTVEMEAASLFVFGRHRRVRTVSVLVISDLLDEDGWKPEFHRVRGRLEEVATAIIDASRGGSPRSTQRRQRSRSRAPPRRAPSGR